MVCLAAIVLPLVALQAAAQPRPRLATLVLEIGAGSATIADVPVLRVYTVR